MDQLTAVFEQRPSGWWIAFIEELPGVNTQGETLEEAREQSGGREVIHAPFAPAR